MKARNRRARALPFILLAGLLLAASAGCSASSDDEKVPKAVATGKLPGPCKAVSADQVAKAIGAVRVRATPKGTTCIYRAPNPSTQEAWVESRSLNSPDELSLLLPDGQVVKNLGDEAVFDPANGPLGARLIVREGGAAMLIDVGPRDTDQEEARRAAVRIARRGLEALPHLKIPEVPRASSWCERYLADAEDESEDAYVVTLAANGDSCELSRPNEYGGITVTVLEPKGVTAERIEQLATQLGDLATEPVDIGDAALFIPDGSAPGRTGQLYVVADGQLVQLTVRAQVRDSAGVRKVAVEAAKRGLA